MRIEGGTLSKHGQMNMICKLVFPLPIKENMMCDSNLLANKTLTNLYTQIDLYVQK